MAIYLPQRTKGSSGFHSVTVETWTGGGGRQAWPPPHARPPAPAGSLVPLPCPPGGPGEGTHGTRWNLERWFHLSLWTARMLATLWKQLRKGTRVGTTGTTT